MSLLLRWLWMWWRYTGTVYQLAYCHSLLIKTQEIYRQWNHFRVTLGISAELPQHWTQVNSFVINKEIFVEHFHLRFFKISIFGFLSGKTEVFSWHPRREWWLISIRMECLMTGGWGKKKKKKRIRGPSLLPNRTGNTLHPSHILISFYIPELLPPHEGFYN